MKWAGDRAVHPKPDAYARKAAESKGRHMVSRKPRDWRSSLRLLRHEFIAAREYHSMCMLVAKITERPKTSEDMELLRQIRSIEEFKETTALSEKWFEMDSTTARSLKEDGLFGISMGYLWTTPEGDEQELYFLQKRLVESATERFIELADRAGKSLPKHLLPIQPIHPFSRPSERVDHWSSIWVLFLFLTLKRLPHPPLEQALSSSGLVGYTILTEDAFDASAKVIEFILRPANPKHLKWLEEFRNGKSYQTIALDHEIETGESVTWHAVHKAIKRLS